MAVPRSTVQWLGLILAPILALLTYLLLPDSAAAPPETSSLGHSGRASAALAVWMAVWWVTEAIPIYATALLPICILPLAGAGTIRQAAAPYAHELIFLFMGGFLIALSMERWNLHRRIALRALRFVGSRPRRVVGGFMVITAFLSMWVSNTATAIMMLPIATSVIDRVGEAERREFGLCLLLGIAYGASIGGLATLIGTPPNLFLASYLESQLGAEISFVRWMGIGLPLTAVFLPIAWWILTTLLFPIRFVRVGEGSELVRQALKELGPMKRGERAALAVFLLAAGAWISRPLLVQLECWGVHPLAGLSDPGIAMLAALALFVIPVDREQRIFAMDWPTARRLPWGLLLLFGGGLSLAAAIRTHGVGEFLGHQVGALAGLPPLALVLLVVALVIFLTELTSNTATTATLIPILAGLAPGLGLHPYLLIVPAALAASCAFMLPVATPPNAVVFGSGRISIPEMCRAGLSLNLIGIALITTLTYAIALPLLGVDP